MAPLLYFLNIMVVETNPSNFFEIEESQDIERSFNYATAALEEALQLQEKADTIVSLSKHMDAQQEKLLNVAVENLCAKYHITNAALESIDEEEESQVEHQSQEAQSSEAVGKLKRTIDFIYAMLRRLVQALIHRFQQHRGQARTFMERAKDLIGRADVVNTGGEIPTIPNRGVLNALCINGVPPKGLNLVFDELVKHYEQSKKYSGLTEMVAMLNAAKSGDMDKTKDRSEILWVLLRDGMEECLNKVDNPSNHFMFGDAHRGHQCYASQPYFGDISISGEISDSVGAFGSFFHKVQMRRNPDSILRVDALKALDEQTIRLICRSVVRLCESVIRSSRDEAFLYKAIREANYLVGKKPDQLSLHALRNFQSIAQNLYINYLRLTMNSAKHLLEYCELSVAKYEKQNDPLADA